MRDPTTIVQDLPVSPCIAHALPILFFNILKRLLSSPTMTLGKDVLLPSMDLAASGVLGPKESLLCSPRLDTSLAGVAVDSSSPSGVLVDATDAER
jgi:hypothetical protein